MVRDRLQEMKIMIGDEGGSRSSVRKPVNLQKSIDQAYEDIDTIQESIGRLAVEHNKVLSSIPSTTTNRIDGIVEEIHQIATGIKNVLMKLKTTVSADDKSAKGRMKFSQYTSLSKKFADVMYDFNEEQLRYREKCKEQIRRQMEISGQQVSDRGLEDMLEKGNVFVDDCSQMAIEEARLVVNEVKARHRDILKLEESIRQMKKLFEDIANMIEEQGEAVSRIEDYVSTTVEFVGKGQQELATAETYQSAARRKKVYCVAILVIVVVIIIIVVAVTSQSGKK